MKYAAIIIIIIYAIIIIFTIKGIANVIKENNENQKREKKHFVKSSIATLILLAVIFGGIYFIMENTKKIQPYNNYFEMKEAENKLEEEFERNGENITVSNGIIMPYLEISDGGTITVKESKTIPKNVVIPDIFNGVIVKYINTEAFKNQTKLETIVLPKRVTHIYESAFENCYNLKTIIISDETIAIRENAFKNCTSLYGINLSDEILYIHKTAFEGCSSLRIEQKYFNGIYPPEMDEYD